jgi:hypothetical protein
MSMAKNGKQTQRRLGLLAEKPDQISFATNLNFILANKTMPHFKRNKREKTR